MTALTGPLPYAAIFFAAIVEGEAVFVAASVLVAAGTLQTWPVLVAGALGAATGDQIYFYALRGHLHRWLDRWTPIATRRDAIVARVRRHQSLMVLAVRFTPGLRIIIAAACAYAGVAAWRFSTLNLIAAFVWAASLLLVVSRVGPAVLQMGGIRPVWGAIVVAMVIAIVAWRIGRRTSAQGDAETNGPA